MTKPTAANAAGLSPRPLDDVGLGLLHLEKLLDMIIDAVAGIGRAHLRPAELADLQCADSLSWIGRDYVRRLSGIVEAMEGAGR